MVTEVFPRLYDPSVSVIEVTLVTEVSGNSVLGVTPSQHNPCPLFLPVVVHLNMLMPLVAGDVIPIS